MFVDEQTLRYCFYEFKLIRLHLIEKYFGKSFKFHSDLLFKSNKTKLFSSFYCEIILNSKKDLVMITEIPSCVLFQYLWCNENIQVDKTFVQISRFFEKNIYYLLQLVNKNDMNNNGIKKA